MSRTSYSFPPNDYVKKVVDPAKVLNQEELSQLIVIKPDRKTIPGPKTRKGVDGKGDTPPPKHSKPDATNTSRKKAEQSASVPLIPSQRQSEDRRIDADAPTANGMLPSHSKDQDSKHESEPLDKGESKNNTQSGPEGHAQVLDIAAEERRLNEVETGNRDNSGRWWLRKPKPREPEGNAEKENAEEETRVVVWSQPRLLKAVNTLAMPYVTSMD